MQVPRGRCPDTRTLRPVSQQVNPPIVGGYTYAPKPMCLNNLPERRDVGKPTWGRLHCPKADMERGADGFAVPTERPLQRVATEQGAIDLPVGPDMAHGYLPNSATLSLWSDTRATGFSDRYYM